jgi:hypothetical protein
MSSKSREKDFSTFILTARGMYDLLITVTRTIYDDNTTATTADCEP